MTGPARLDRVMLQRGLASSRSQAENLIKLGLVRLNRQTVLKPATNVSASDKITLAGTKTYVGRGGYKLAASLAALKLSLKNKVVLDVGSSTGGFSQVALSEGASKIMAVDSGKDQLHPSLITNPKVESYEQTDIRQFKLKTPADLALVDVSFISLRQVLPSLRGLVKPGGEIIALLKPQFEASEAGLKHKGVIKNDRIRRQIFKDFELWAKADFKIMAKADSIVPGTKGNIERFYKLVPIR